MRRQRRPPASGYIATRKDPSLRERPRGRTVGRWLLLGLRVLQAPLDMRRAYSDKAGRDAYRTAGVGARARDARAVTAPIFLLRGRGFSTRERELHRW